mmetsp:Transcript_26935/g.74033  ORF Transcript_26935/g.74033 Transcript_26935/m.74033 type:complete len:578 (-) Transcript_26935:166-1899(-)
MDFIGNNTKGNTITPAEKQIRPLLFDEGIQVLSNFELNQIASLTYNDLSCDGMFELIETICRTPLDHTPLTIQKSLIVTKHIVIYGSEITVNHAYGIQDFIKPLQEFNTVLVRRKQGGPMSFLQNLQGGGVDKGGPVRDAAEQVIKLLSNINELRRIRVASASQDSLVPVGDNKVGFVTDEVRFQVLKRRIDEENRIRIQSNLKKSEGGFGGGYASKDGKNVVGAAHGIDEMIKMANLQTKKFSDDGRNEKTREEIILEELKAQAEAEKAAKAAANAPTVDDLLGSFDPTPKQPVGDLLDFGAASNDAGSTNSTAATGDLLGGGLGSGTAPATTSNDDPFGFASAYNTATTQSAPIATPATNNLLDIATQNDPFTAHSDPFSSSNNTHSSDVMSLLDMTSNATNATANPLASMMQTPTEMPMQMQNAKKDSGDTTGMTNDLSSTMTSMSLSEPPPKPPVMGSNEDRFSALDALAESAAMSSQVGFGSTHMSEATQPPSLNSAETEYSAPMPMGMPPPPPVHQTMIAPGSGKVAAAYGDAGGSGDDDNPWVMGGSMGMGLEPMGPEPSAPPPPPPPDF